MKGLYFEVIYSKRCDIFVYVNTFSLYTDLIKACYSSDSENSK